MSRISIQGLDPAEVLAALFNAAIPIPSWASDTVALTRDEADAMLREQSLFGYWRGRHLGLCFGEDELDVGAYDLEHGYGAGELVVQSVRENGFRLVKPVAIQSVEDGVFKKVTAADIRWRRAELI